MAENIESTWSLDIASVLEGLEKVHTGFDKTAKLEDKLFKAARQKYDPFKEAAKSATGHNKAMADGLRQYTIITNSAKAYGKEIAGLEREIAKLTEQQKKMVKASQYTQLKKELEELRVKMKQVNDEQKKVDAASNGRDKKGRFTGESGGLGGQIGALPGKLVSNLTGYVAGLFAAEKAFDLIITKPAEFGKALSQLSSITGATGKDLEFLRDQAVQFEKDTGKSAVSIVEAFQVVGSIKPELLENKQLLVATTKEVIALQDAAGNISLEDAAESLLGSLNQFNEGADQASRFVNVLAAGAKEGSSEIQNTAAAFKASGSALASAGISFEQSNALVQVLAKNMILGSESGTQLRNIFLKLEASADKNLRPSVVGLETALGNAAQKFNTTTKLTKEFGVENVLAAKQILDNRGEINRLTQALTGTSTAYQQQAKNLDNLYTDLQKLSTSFTGTFRDIGLQEEGILRRLVQATTRMIDLLRSGKSEFVAFFKGLNPVNGGGLYSAVEGFVAQRRANQQERETKAAKEARVKSITSQTGQQVATSLNDRLDAERRQLGKEYDETVAKVKVAEEELAARRLQVVEARAAYKDAVSKGLIKGNTLTGEGAELTAAKQAVKVSEQQLVLAQKQKKLRDENQAKAALDSGKTDKEKNAEVKLEENKNKLLIDAKEKLKKEIADIEQDFSKEELDRLDKDSEAYLKKLEESQLAELALRKSQLIKLGQLATSTNVRKNAKTGELEIAPNPNYQLPAELQKQFLDAENAIRADTNKKRVEIQQKQDDELLGLQKDSLDKRVKQIENHYRDLIKKEKAGSDRYKELVKLQTSEIANARLEDAFTTNEKQEQVDKDVVERTPKPDGMGLVAFEKWKQQKMLEITIEYSQRRVEILEAENNPDNIPAISNLKTVIFKAKEELESLKNQPKFGSIWELLGVDQLMKKDEFQAFLAGVDQMKTAINDLLQVQIDASKERIAAIDDEISKKQQQLDDENALAKDGLANNSALRQQELTDLKAKKAQEQAELKKAVVAQILLDKASAASTQIVIIADAISAVVKAIKAKAALPIGGIIAGAAAAISLTAIIASAKSQMKAAVKLRKGGWLSGPDHEHGGIRGTGAFGHIEVEGDEHVTRKGRAQRFAGLLDAVNEGPVKPMPWDDLQKLASERGILLHETTGIASAKNVGAIAGSIRDRASVQPLSQKSLDRLVDEVAAMREENNKRWDRDFETETLVIGKTIVTKTRGKTSYLLPGGLIPDDPLQEKILAELKKIAGKIK